MIYYEGGFVHAACMLSLNLVASAFSIVAMNNPASSSFPLSRSICVYPNRRAFSALCQFVRPCCSSPVLSFAISF
ncbi:hypothetical protein BKA64DRAFT_378712 [Cadophora sp. MPI-SDFR-AT-0126]|nr:hypothetical protein BKA64DRAFT_378712 [Leotiomycetes sp. MPI-SDFR-AT-0126]